MNETIASASLNHMSFPTPDVTATTKFFEKYLGFNVFMLKDREFAILKRPGLDVVIESTGKDAPTVKALTADSAEGAFHDFVGADDADPKWPFAFHIGLELPTVEDVHILRDQLAADGFTAETAVFNNNRGSRFFLRAPGGVMCEFNTRSDGGDEQFRDKLDR